MTRKDYILIAEALAAARCAILNKEPAESHAVLLDGLSYGRDYLAYALGSDNPRFDRERFLKACGVQS